VAFDHTKYQAVKPVAKTDRRWPDQHITQAPQWCSVDLRDGNQALIDPMSPAQKMEMFKLLVDIGFKEIEVGFPAASQTDFDFVRELIENDLIPEDVTIQVLVQAREELIARTYESLVGAKRAIVHVYNSTSVIQREQVFVKSKDEIKQIAVNGAKWVKEYAEKQPGTDWQFQYSPESFTQTEVEYAVEVADAVMAVWQPTPEKKAILNLPATVEVAMPNVYADQIEWICDNLANRESIIVSLHTHNDRGCGVAAAEMGILAGADRVEGTLLGNGERTGNMDVVTAAMNLYSQGIDPKLDFSNMDRVINVVEACTAIKLHPRHAYAGELVFAAFSGSHQDAIRKCLSKRESENETWRVAYLPIDPKDIGRNYQEIIRINSQSGKGGIAYVLEQDYGIHMPRWMQVDFSRYVQQMAEDTEAEVSPAAIADLFFSTYMPKADSPVAESYSVTRENGVDHLSVDLSLAGERKTLKGQGQGVLDAFVKAISAQTNVDMVLVEYTEHTLGDSGESEAMAYVQMNIAGQRVCGAGQSSDILGASIAAVLHATSRVSPQWHLAGPVAI